MGDVNEDMFVDDPSDADPGADTVVMIDDEERMVEASPLMLPMASLEQLVLPSVAVCVPSARSLLKDDIAKASSWALAISSLGAHFVEF